MHTYIHNTYITHSVSKVREEREERRERGRERGTGGREIGITVIALGVAEASPRSEEDC